LNISPRFISLDIKAGWWGIGYFRSDGIPFVQVNSLRVRLLIITAVADQWVVGYLHRGDCAVAEREELEVEVENILGKELGEL
jgi:hypothetical protein